MGSAVAEGVDGDRPGRPPSPWRERRIPAVAALAVGLVAVDQLTKHWAVNRLSDGRTIELVGSLRLWLTWNTGASFSMGEGRNIGPLVALLAFALVGWLLWSGHSRSVLGAVAAGMVAGGAAGNLVDRAFRSGPHGAEAGFLGGAVVDFIDLQWWPVFNVADAAVVVGAVLLVLTSLRDGAREAADGAT